METAEIINIVFYTIFAMCFIAYQIWLGINVYRNKVNNIEDMKDIYNSIDDVRSTAFDDSEDVRRLLDDRCDDLDDEISKLKSETLQINS